MLDEPLTPEEGGLKISGKVLREEGVCLTLCNHLAPQGKWTSQSPGSAPLFSSFESSNGQLSQWKGVTSGCLEMLSMYMNVCIMATKHPTSVLGRNKKGLSQELIVSHVLPQVVKLKSDLRQ